MSAQTRKRAAARATCLVLMLKAPERSKRRLAATIGERAADVASHLSACALEDLAAWPGPVCLAPAAPGDRAWLNGRSPAGAMLVQQAGGNLGERIEHVGRALRARGHRRQIFIGIDCPELDPPYLGRAALALESHDTVLGPASDGGVVLLGTRTAWPDLSTLPWSGADLLRALRTRCESDGQRIALLEPRSDVDTVADLLGARERLRGDRRAARRALHGWLDGQAEVLEQCC